MNERRNLSPREIWFAVGGGLVAVLAIAVVWVLTGRQPAPPAPVAEVNRPAPAFALPALDGSTVTLSDYRGKVVLLNFWNTWCEPCKEETPALQAVYSRLREQGLVVIGVNLANQEQNGVEAIKSFAERYEVSYPIALDQAGEVSRAFRIYPLPTSYFIDQQGNIRYVIVRTTTSNEVEQLFRQLQNRASAQR
jgi:peroxiredoxin